MGPYGWENLISGRGPGKAGFANWNAQFGAILGSRAGPRRLKKQVVKNMFLTTWFLSTVLVPLGGRWPPIGTILGYPRSILVLLGGRWPLHFLLNGN